MRRPRGDEGAYAILYALLLLVVLGTAAIVVDLGGMRQDRRQSRLVADAAVVAAAQNLDPLAGGNPQQACLDAWSYINTNLDVPIPASTNCSNLGTVTSPCPVIQKTATATSQDVTVTVTWPVLQGSTLLTQPNAAPADSSVTARAVDPATDGTNPCARIAVTVKQKHEPLFASLWGSTGTTTIGTSVARALTTPGNGQDIAALNVLNQTVCEAVNMSGQAFLQISSVGGRPGIIAVESSGRQTSGHCPPSADWVISAAKNSSGGYIRADGPAGLGTGTILSYALNPTPDGNPAQAFNINLTPPTNTLLQPRPVVLTKRSGTTPITTYLQCNGTCTTVSQDYIGLLQSKMTASPLPLPYTYSDAPYDTMPFVTLPGVAVPSFTCTIGNGTKLRLPAGNWYLNCPTLTVRGTLLIAGGTVVTGGAINVAGGCFAMNVPQAVVAGGPTCPTVSGGDSVPPPTTAGLLYMRNGGGGHLTTSGAYSIVMPRTFVYMTAGHIDIAANANNVLWTNPRVTNLSCTSDECLSQHFSKMTLWNTSNDQGQALGGQGSLTMRGVLFMPNAKFTYTGQAAQVQTNAQFWTDTIEVKGQGGLTMAPDPTDSFATPLLAVVLIR